METSNGGSLTISSFFSSKCGSFSRKVPNSSLHHVAKW
jgi:hypothetical protein